MNWLRSLAIILLLVTPAAAQSQITLYLTEAAVQACRGDQVVWVNLPTGIYHFRGERWYGRTKNGAFVCRIDADRHGFRTTRNGQ